MKATLLFVTLATWMMGPDAFGMTELEALRERCARQEQEIRRLESQIQQSAGSRSTATVKSSATPAATSSASTYVVRKGDSIERIARRHGCSAQALAKSNGLKSSALIHPGQKLKVPGGSSMASSAESPAKTVSTPASSASQATESSKTHKIAAGETYASIARKHRVSVSSLIAANPGVKPTALRPGQVIRLGAAASSKPAPVPSSRPVAESRPAQAIVSSIGSQTTPKPTETVAAHVPASTTALARTSQPVTTTAPMPAAAPAAPAAAPVAKTETPAASSPAPASTTPPAPSNNPEKKIRSVTIEGEMSYGEFAAKHGTDTDRLNDLNGLDLTHATVLAKGSELYVPAQP